MSEEDKEINPSFPKMGEVDLGIEESEANDVIQDQIIIAPEIMNLILKSLDFSSLKRIRLVCKSWLREAVVHLERRGNVRLSSRMAQEFIETYHNGLPDLPQPFKSAVVEFHDAPDPEELVGQLSSLSPPLVITTLSLAEIPLDLSLPLIIESSSHLEYVMIWAEDCEAEYCPPWDSKQMFPKLGHLKVHTRNVVDGTDTRSHFPAIVAWIVKASPHLDAFESWGRLPETTEELASQLLQKVDIKNVKFFIGFHINLEEAAVQHFLSIPFNSLEKLRMCLEDVDGLHQSNDILIETISKCPCTLRVVDLSVLTRELEDLAGFPVLPNLQELTLSSFPSLTNFLTERFPALEVLNVHLIVVDVFGDPWSELNPFLNLKTLRAENIKFVTPNDPQEEFIEFFEKFPALERVQLSSSFVLTCCGLKATGSSRFSSLLGGIKHLELRENPVEGLDPGFSALAVLKGLETITMVSSVLDSDVLFVPYQELPNLKVVKFSWKRGDCSSTMDRMLELARGVEKVVITNCCYLRMMSRLSKKFLDLFFELAPTAECGCKEKNSVELWGWCY